MDHLETTASLEVVKDRVFVWPSVGKSGFVPLDALVRDPEQPRQYFDPIELAKLAASMKAGAQSEIVTVRELTERECATGAFPPVAHYMIVSGERRKRAAELAGLEMIEIRVKHYATRGDQMHDAWILNEDRVYLSDLEIANFVPRLATERGWKTHAEIAVGLRRDKSWVSDYLSVQKLIPEFRARMDPELNKNDRLKIGAASFIAQLDQDVQRSLFVTMPPELKAASRQLAWMKRQLFLRGIAVKAYRRNPAKLRSRIADFTNSFAQSVDGYCLAADLKTMFAGATEGEVRVTLGHINRAKALLDAFDKQISRLASERIEQLQSGADTGASASSHSTPVPRETVDLQLPTVTVLPESPIKFNVDSNGDTVVLAVGTKREFRLEDGMRLRIDGLGQIAINDRPLVLKGQQNKLVFLLAERHGDLVPKSEICEHLGSSDMALRVLLSKVREKFDICEIGARAFIASPRKGVQLIGYVRPVSSDPPSPPAPHAELALAPMPPLEVPPPSPPKQLESAILSEPTGARGIRSSSVNFGSSVVA